MFTKEQMELLTAPLNKSRVAQRSQSGMNLSYLEGYDVIDHANSIFGFHAWNYVISELTEVAKETNAKGNFVVSYIARVTVSVQAGETKVIREDVGYGSGISRSIGDAYESATKEAVTDALKRAMRGFGNQFGNALYDKQQRQVKEYTAEEIIEQVKKIDPTAKVQKVEDFKDAIVEVMIANNVPDTDIPNCAKYLITNGLDISGNPREIYMEKKAELVANIKDYVEASKAIG